jgi:hypothetical protein
MQSQYGTGRFSPERKKPAALLQRVSLIRSHGALRSRMSYFHMANVTDAYKDIGRRGPWLGVLFFYRQQKTRLFRIGFL